MTISSLALAAKKVIDAAWLHGDSCDLSSQAAFALESAQLLQSPETAAEVVQLDAERGRYRTAWRMAYQRAQGRGWAADRAGARARDLQRALQDMLFTVIVAQMACRAARLEAEELRARVAELETRYVAPSRSCTRCYGADAVRFVAQGGASTACPVCEPSEVEQLRSRVAELESVPTTAYRAEHPDSGITLGHYGTAAAARSHCEAEERRSWPAETTLVFDWIEDDEDRVAELVVTAGQNEESTTGYLVTSLELDSEYDEEADQ